MESSRIDRLTAHMKELGLPQILVTATASVYYLTGFWVEPHERMLALWLDDRGQAVLFGNEIFGLPSTPELPVVTHSDSDDPVAALAAHLRPGKVGIDKFWYSKFLIGLMVHRGDITPVHGSDPVDLARKTAVESAVNGESGKMVALLRDSQDGVYRCRTELVPLSSVANQEKKVPLSWIVPEGNNVTEEFVNYVLPLIQGEPVLPVENSLPRYARLKKVFAK